MSTSFRPYSPDQPQLLPPDPRDWLAEDHLAYFVSDTVNALNLDSFYAPYEGDGRRKQPYEPAMMLKVLIYGYATGVFSSRKIARKLYEDVAFRVLAAGNFPSHRTISEFRRRHLEDFESVFVQILRIAREVGLVKLGTVAIDGSKVKANASRHKAMSYDRMQQEEKRLREEIRGLTQRANQTDEQEDISFGHELSGDELPEEISRRDKRLVAIQAAKARLEARQRDADLKRGRHEGDDKQPKGGGRPFKQAFGVPPEKAQDNFTDPESRIMKTSTKGYDQCYNAQIAVDGTAGMIIAADVTQSASDSGQLRPMLDRVRENTKKTPRKVLADAGYASEDNLRSLQRRGIDAYVAMGQGEKKAKKEPTGKHRRQMCRKMKTKQAKNQYRKRKHIAEPPFGWIKSVLGFRSFSLRGLSKVSGEWNLVCLAVNLKRLGNQLVWN